MTTISLFTGVDDFSDEPFWSGSLDEFLAENPEINASELTEALLAGHSFVMGGGAAPEITIVEVTNA